MSTKVAILNLNKRFASPYSTNEIKHLTKAQTEINLNDQMNKQVKKVYQINTQNYYHKERSPNNLLNQSNQANQAQDKKMTNSSFSNLSSQKQNQIIHSNSVKQIILKKQNTLENLNSSNEESLVNAAFPQSAKNGDSKSQNKLIFNSPSNKLTSQKQVEMLKSYFFPSPKLSARLQANPNENSSSLQSYFTEHKQSQRQDQLNSKKRIVLQRDVLNSAREANRISYKNKNINNNLQKEVSYSESANDLKKFEDDSDENITTKAKEYPRTSRDIQYDNNSDLTQNNYVFQTQLISNVPKNTPIKFSLGEINSNSSLQEDISNLNLATTACSSGNEELQSTFDLVPKKQLKVIKIKRTPIPISYLNESYSENSSPLIVQQTNEQKLPLHLFKNRNSLKEGTRNAENMKSNYENSNDTFQQDDRSQLDQSQSINPISQNNIFTTNTPSTEQILNNRFGVFDSISEQNQSIQKLKILSLAECELYEAYQINNLSLEQSNKIKQFIKAFEESKNLSLCDKVIDYTQFIQNNDSSLLIYPFQSNKTLKDLLGNVKLLNEQLVKLFFKDVLVGLQQIYYTMKSSLMSFLDFNQIYFDEKYNLRVGQNINQNNIDKDQFILQQLSQNSDQNQQQCNQSLYRDEQDIIQDFGYLIFKSLLGPNYTIFDENQLDLKSNWNTLLLSNSIKQSSYNHTSCCIFHEIKKISENNISDSFVTLRKANEVNKFISKNCSSELQEVLCGCLRYNKQTRFSLKQLQSYFVEQEQQLNAEQQLLKQKLNSTFIIKLLFQQVQIKEKQQESVKQKTQKLQMLIRIKQMILHSEQLIQTFPISINFQKLVEKLVIKLSYNLSITPKETYDIIYPKKQ